MAFGFINFPAVWTIGTPIPPQWCAQVQSVCNSIVSGVFPGTFIVSGTLGVTGDLSASGSTFLQSANILGTLNVTGSARFTGGAVVSNGLSIQGTTNINGTVSVQNTLNVNQNVVATDVVANGVVYGLAGISTSGSVGSVSGGPLHGHLYNDMLTLSWGTIETDGTIIGGRNIASASRTGAGAYTVTMTSGSTGTNNYSVTLTPEVTTANGVQCEVQRTSATVFTVKTYQGSAFPLTATDTRFNFHVFGLF